MNIFWNDFTNKIYGMVAGASLGGAARGDEKYLEFGNPVYTALDVIMPAVRTIEDCGMNFSPMDMAEHYSDAGVIYSEEYAYFKRNFGLGLRPPYTGIYGNPYKDNFTGTLKAGFWGTMGAANPALAVKICEKAKCIETGKEAFEAEKYFTAMAALAYSSKSSMRTMRELVLKSFEFIEEKSIAGSVISDVISWCDPKETKAFVTGNIIKKYGSANRKDFKQNLGLVVAALILCEGDMERMTEFVKNSKIGYPEYCLSLIGEIIGIIEGGSQLDQKYRIASTVYIPYGVASDEGKKLSAVSKDIALVSLMFYAANKKLTMKDAPVANAPKKGNSKNLYFTVEYENDDPLIEPGQSKKIKLVLNRTGNAKFKGTVKFVLPEGFSSKKETTAVKSGVMAKNPEISVIMAKNIPLVMEKNIITAVIQFGDRDIAEEKIGLPGAAVFKTYGPFSEPYDNSGTAPKAVGRGAQERVFTNHYNEIYNLTADIDREYLEAQLISNANLGSGFIGDPRYVKKMVYSKGETVKVDNFCGFEGPCVVYIERDIYSEKERNVRIEIGCSDAFKLWQNGELIARSDKPEYFTGKNAIIDDVILRKNENRFVLKLLRNSGPSDFSMTVFDDLTGRKKSDILTDLGSYQ